MDNYTELRKAIEAGPTGGTWTHEPSYYNKLDRILYSGRDGTTHGLQLMTLADGDWNHVNNVNYIAAANPAVIKQLLADYDRVKAENERLREALKPLVIGISDASDFDDMVTADIPLGVLRRARAEIGEG